MGGIPYVATSFPNPRTIGLSVKGMMQKGRMDSRVYLFFAVRALAHQASAASLLRVYTLLSVTDTPRSNIDYEVLADLRAMKA